MEKGRDVIVLGQVGNEASILRRHLCDFLAQADPGCIDYGQVGSKRLEKLYGALIYTRHCRVNVGELVNPFTTQPG
jgi:hypothetical protein